MRSECKITFFLNSNDLEKVIEHLCMKIKKRLTEQQFSVRLFLIKATSVPNYKKGYFMSQSYRFDKNLNRLLLIRLPQFYQTD